MKTLFVKNLNFIISDEEINILFSVFGEIHSFKRPIDRRTKLKQGFCFVEMEDNAAMLAMKALDGSELGGRVLTVELSKKSQEVVKEAVEQKENKTDSNPNKEKQAKQRQKKNYKPKSKTNTEDKAK